MNEEMGRRMNIAQENVEGNWTSICHYRKSQMYFIKTETKPKNSKGKKKYNKTKPNSTHTIYSTDDCFALRVHLAIFNLWKQICIYACVYMQWIQNPVSLIHSLAISLLVRWHFLHLLCRIRWCLVEDTFTTPTTVNGFTLASGRWLLLLPIILNPSQPSCHIEVCISTSGGSQSN